MLLACNKIYENTMARDNTRKPKRGITVGSGVCATTVKLLLHFYIWEPNYYIFVLTISMGLVYQIRAQSCEKAARLKDRQCIHWHNDVYKFISCLQLFRHIRSAWHFMQFLYVFIHFLFKKINSRPKSMENKKGRIIYFHKLSYFPFQIQTDL